MPRRASHFLVLLLAVAPPAAGAAATPTGDVAPGRAVGPDVRPTWIAEGDGRVDIADLLVLSEAAAGRLTLAGASLRRADLAPGVEFEGLPPRWLPVGNGLVDSGDLEVAWRLAIGELVPKGLPPGLVSIEVGAGWPPADSGHWRWDDGWGPAWDAPTTGPGQGPRRGRGKPGGDLTR